MYSYMYAMLASLTNNLEDADRVTEVPFIFLTVGFVLGIIGLQNLNSGWVLIFSHIPFTAPFLFYIRAISGTIAMWEIVFSVGSLICTILFMGFLGSYIYRKGILAHGNMASFRTLLCKAFSIRSISKNE